MNIQEIVSQTNIHRDWIVGVRRALHQYPELGYDLVRTSSIVRSYLDELEIPYEFPRARTGIVAILGHGDGPCVALRADMDALPIEEATGLSFASLNDGAMHACGHDCHTAMLLGAGRVLKANENRLPGRVKLLFQPAEESGAGAKALIEEGVLDAPAVERVFGIHVWPMLPTGSIAGRPGTILAAVTELDILIKGSGGHAGMPHLTRDPVVAAAKVICELQSIISRELDPLQPGVISIACVNGGTAFNAIPSSVQLKGTIRSLSTNGLETLKARVREVSQLVAEANRCEARVTFPSTDYPPTFNAPECWDLARSIGEELSKEGQLSVSDGVQEMDPVMGGEDFAFYTQRVPCCFVALGVGNEAKRASFGLHHPQFDADEDALPIGATLHVAFALRSLESLQR